MSDAKIVDVSIDDVRDHEPSGALGPGCQPQIVGIMARIMRKK